VNAWPPSANETLCALKAEAAAGIASAIPGAVIIGPKPEDTDSAPHILCVSLPPVKAETMVHALAAENVIVGTGAACSSRSRKRSAVLTAMGVPEKLMDSAVRISFSPSNTRAEIQTAVKAVAAQYDLLSKFTRR
jgi:cysteine desulfurase